MATSTLTRHMVPVARNASMLVGAGEEQGGDNKSFFAVEVCFFCILVLSCLVVDCVSMLVWGLGGSQRGKGILGR